MMDFYYLILCLFWNSVHEYLKFMKTDGHQISTPPGCTRSMTMIFPLIRVQFYIHVDNKSALRPLIASFFGINKNASN